MPESQRLLAPRSGSYCLDCHKIQTKSSHFFFTFVHNLVDMGIVLSYIHTVAITLYALLNHV